jgi:murein DD-endopeptidase MepM/ murein hydrolase activator NlpD
MKQWIKASGVALAFIMALALLVMPLPTDALEEESVPVDQVEGYSSPNLQSPFQCPGAPFIVPSGNYVSANYHYCRGEVQCNPANGGHSGIDLKLYVNGQPNTVPGVVPVYAAYAGTVIMGPLGGPGNVPQGLDIRHTNVGGQAVVYTYYAHMANASRTETYIVVQDGQWVEQGQVIGYQGNYGASSVHLHFSVNYPGLHEWYNNQDPSSFLGFNVNGDNGASPGYITSDRCQKCCGQCCCKTSSMSSLDSCAPTPTPVMLPLPTATSVPLLTSESNFTPLPTLPRAVTPLPTVAALAAWQQAVTQLNTAPPASAHYILVRSVFGSGGGPKTSAHYEAQDTSGQTTGVAWRQSSSYVLRSGYWGRVGAAPEPAPYIIYLPIVIKQP